MSFYHFTPLLVLTPVIFFASLNPGCFNNCRHGSLMSTLKESLSTMIKFNSYPLTMMGLGLFLILFIFNFSGLFSWVFSFTCTPSTCFSMGLTLWFTFLIYNCFSNFSVISSHLVPANCPLYLISFMVLIESISLLIRPLTLTVRLMANISAGHLLILLSSNLMISSGALILLEILVSVVQSFVFTLLLSLYFNESN